MNVYDFDGTIFDGDSEKYLWEFIFKNYKISFRNKIKFYYSRFIEKTKLSKNYTYTREIVYSILEDIENIDLMLNNFWDEHQKLIKPFYLKNHKDDDLIISATPEFILVPIIKRLNVNRLIATKFDVDSRKMKSKFNYKDEKVNRFLKEYSKDDIDEFYSDSDSDIPMVKISKKSFRVTNNNIELWILKNPE